MGGILIQLFRAVTHTLALPKDFHIDKFVDPGDLRALIFHVQIGHIVIDHAMLTGDTKELPDSRCEKLHAVRFFLNLRNSFCEKQIQIFFRFPALSEPQQQKSECSHLALLSVFSRK